MSVSIDQAFVKQFESEVHQAYQRMGSKLRNTIRTKNGIKGSSTTFQKVGKDTIWKGEMRINQAQVILSLCGRK
jgi:hypothetical protein